MKRILISAAVMAMFLVFSMQAYAALTTIGQAQYDGGNYKLIWDNDNNGNSLVWLDYTKYDSIYGYNSWHDQMEWAKYLNNGPWLTYNIDPGYSVTWSSDWRLPTTVDGPWVLGYDGTTTAGYNITSSEMGHLFYTELGNKGYYDTSGNGPQAGWGLTKTGDFQNLQPTDYWSGTRYEAEELGGAWFFYTNYGFQSHGWDVETSRHAIAVRSGDVSVAVAPEPVSMVLFGVGGVVLAARRKLLRRHG